MDYKELGRFITQARRDKRCSQQRLADHIGVSRATISALEQGRSGDVGLRKVMKMLDFLGYELITRARTPFPTLEELRDG